jgi:histidinol-phosphate/aromatic aminotransferase/cobyric acid decarboxylase-like protein/choline kinase
VGGTASEFCDVKPSAGARPTRYGRDAGLADGIGKKRVAKRIGARKAIILAAGAGRRLGGFTDIHPKPLLPVNGVPILGNCLKRLSECGVEEVVIVVGHFREQIEAFAGEASAGMRVRYVVSEQFRTTNNIYSLWLARHELNEDILLVEADILFDGALLPALQKADADNVAAVARFARGMDGTVVKLDDESFLTHLIEGREQGPGFDYACVYKTVNLYRLGREYLAEEFVPALEHAIQEGHTGDYYERLLKCTLARGRHRVLALDCTHMPWYEVDDHVDRAAAEYGLLSAEERLKFLNGQYGGYWRYGLADHAYIYNPYFPTAEMWRRLKSDFEDVAKQYPVGQKALAEAAALAFDVPPHRLVIANGASELIRIVCGQLNKRIIVPVPCFNEYENATPPLNMVRFELPWPEFNLDVDALAEQAQMNRAEIVVVVSPNNPTSLAVSRDDILRLCGRLGRDGTLLLLDESFIDFAEDPASGSLMSAVADHGNLVILKSLSKACGVAGLRLGYLYSANTAFLAVVRKALPIWNVNGFGESFLRHFPRYRPEFAESCRKAREDTVRLYQGLRSIEGGRAYPPEANFVFWRLPDGIAGQDLVARLFVEHDILIKDCSEKTMDDGAHYVRISSRTDAENCRLLDCLRRNFNIAGSSPARRHS